MLAIWQHQNWSSVSLPQNHRHNQCQKTTGTSNVRKLPAQPMSQNHRHNQCYKTTGTTNATKPPAQPMPQNHRHNQCHKTTGTTSVTKPSHPDAPVCPKKIVLASSIYFRDQTYGVSTSAETHSWFLVD